LDGALPNALQKRLRGRSASRTSTLERGGRGGAEKTSSSVAPATPPLLLPGVPPAVGRGKEVTGGVPDTGGVVEEAAGDGDGRRRLWMPAVQLDACPLPRQVIAACCSIPRATGSARAGGPPRSCAALVVPLLRCPRSRGLPPCLAAAASRGWVEDAVEISCEGRGSGSQACRGGWDPHVSAARAPSSTPGRPGAPAAVDVGMGRRRSRGDLKA
jgi:hypothetical protein